MSLIHITITSDLNNHRIDKATKSLCQDVSRNQIQKAIKNGNLKLNGQIISNLSVKVKENDLIELELKEEIPTHLEKANIPLDIVFEDEDVIVVNKPVGMTTHPGAGCHNDTLVNALMYHTMHLSDVGGEIRPGIVHRLDKDTSGLMVVAKNNKAHTILAEQLQNRTLKRSYKALVWGIVKPHSGQINMNIGRNPHDRKKMTTLKNAGKTAITNYTTLKIFVGGVFSLLECRLDTGRTHQIRVHLSHFAHSIVGDKVYGNNKRKIANISDEIRGAVDKFDHQALHSFYISFVHPTSGELLEFEKDVPDDYNELLRAISMKVVQK